MVKHVLWLAVTVLGLIGGLTLPTLGAGEPAQSASAASAAELADAKKAESEYYELFSVLADTIDQVERNYVQKLSRRELVEAAIQGILHKLDPYSNYIAPEDITRFRTSVENQFGGIGIQVTMDNGALRILSPLVNSPAYRAGLQAGDRIVAIEGESTEGHSIEDAVKKLKGEVGTQVNLTVQNPDQGEPRKVTLTREMVHLETVLGDSRLSTDQWNFMLDPEAKIGYIRLTGFSRDTAAELRQALGQLKNDGLRGLILDLRFNPGGLLNSAVEVSDLFVSEGKIVSTEGRNTEPRIWNAHAEGTFDGFPMAVLVNRFSASSSEIVAACLQDHKRAKIVGERTWGKGSVQNVVELEGGRSALKLTTASYMRPSGKNIHKFPTASEKDEWGVLPDDGLALRLEDDELRQLIEYRRRRDIIQPKQAAKIEEPVAINLSEADKSSATEKSGTDQPKTESNDQPSESPPADPKSQEGDKTAGPKSDAAPPDAGGEDGEQKKGDSEAEKSPQSESKPAADGPSQHDAEEAKFLDRQLTKAIEYIKGELGGEKP